MESAAAGGLQQSPPRAIHLLPIFLGQAGPEDEQLGHDLGLVPSGVLPIPDQNAGMGADEFQNVRLTG